MNAFVRRSAAAMITIVVLLGCLSCSAPDAPLSERRVEWGMVIHGGAGTIVRERMTPELEQEYRAALTESLRAGHRVLREAVPDSTR